MQLILHSLPYPTHQTPPPLSCIPLKVPSFLIFPISSPCQNPLSQNPYLLAPLGCCHGLLLSLFLFDFLPQLSKTHLSFLSFYSVFAKFIRNPFENFVLFFLLSFSVSLCVQEQVEETYIMVKPDAVQRGLVSFTSICLQFLTNLCQIWLLRKHRGKV